MCGIVTIYSFSDAADPVSRRELRAIGASMEMRGPDGEGEWFSEDGKVAMGHRRLSIIDLSDAASQPMSDEELDLHLVFNGEIYNYRELRVSLEKKGHRFQSNSDTEVILHLYNEYGADLVHMLRGMFAFCIWDARDQRLLVARDPFGIKPLFYSASKGTIRIASQVKALMHSEAVSKAPSPVGIVGFLLWGNVPEPYSVYEHVRAVPAGSYFTVDSHGISRITTYWSPVESYRSVPDRWHGRNELTRETVRNEIRESVRYHLVADVDVGVFLSAGIDSSVILTFASQLCTSNVETVTLAFESFVGTEKDERLGANTIAGYFDCRHHDVWVTRREFSDAVESVLNCMDQPTIDGINTFLVSKAAREIGLKVALSGLGGDELCGGYQSFRNITAMTRLMSMGPGKWLCHKVLPYVKHLPSNRPKEKLKGLSIYCDSLRDMYYLQRGLFMPWELARHVDIDLLDEGMGGALGWKEEVEPTGHSVFSRVAVLEQTMYMKNQLLRDSDWAGMANSVEIRVPLVDRYLHTKIAGTFEQAYNFIEPKGLLVESCLMQLPRRIRNRKKSGFNVPMAEWVESDRNIKRRCSTWAKTWALHCLDSVFHGDNVLLG